jgi:hypothetical protein
MHSVSNLRPLSDSEIDAVNGGKNGRNYGGGGGGHNTTTIVEIVDISIGELVAEPGSAVSISGIGNAVADVSISRGRHGFEFA